MIHNLLRAKMENQIEPKTTGRWDTTTDPFIAQRDRADAYDSMRAWFRCQEQEGPCKQQHETPLPVNYTLSDPAGVGVGRTTTI
jgi:hypothetical protein